VEHSSDDIKHWESRILSKSTAQIRDILDRLSSMSLPIAEKRARIIGTEAEEIIVKELKEALDRRRGEYLEIDVFQQSNVVQAKLAQLQGAEIEVTKQLAMWTNAELTKKGVDIRMRICEDILKTRDGYVKKRRIGNE